MNDLVSVHVVAGTDDLDQEEARFWFCEATAAAEHVHERTAVTKFEGHVDVVVVFETFVKTDDVGVGQRTMNLYFRVELATSERESGEHSERRTFVFAFLVLRDVLVTTLQAWRVPRTSFTSYTRAKPPCERC